MSEQQYVDMTIPVTVYGLHAMCWFTLFISSCSFGVVGVCQSAPQNENALDKGCCCRAQLGEMRIPLSFKELAREEGRVVELRCKSQAKQKLTMRMVVPCCFAHL